MLTHFVHLSVFLSSKIYCLTSTSLFYNQQPACFLLVISNEPAVFWSSVIFLLLCFCPQPDIFQQLTNCYSPLYWFIDVLCWFSSNLCSPVHRSDSQFHTHLFVSVFFSFWFTVSYTSLFVLFFTFFLLCCILSTPVNKPANACWFSDQFLSFFFN